MLSSSSSAKPLVQLAHQSCLLDLASRMRSGEPAGAVHSFAAHRRAPHNLRAKLDHLRLLVHIGPRPGSSFFAARPPCSPRRILITDPLGGAWWSGRRDKAWWMPYCVIFARALQALHATQRVLDRHGVPACVSSVCCTPLPRGKHSSLAHPMRHLAPILRVLVRRRPVAAYDDRIAAFKRASDPPLVGPHPWLRLARAAPSSRRSHLCLSLELAHAGACRPLPRHSHSCGDHLSVQRLPAHSDMRVTGKVVWRSASRSHTLTRPRNVCSQATDAQQVTQILSNFSALKVVPLLQLFLWDKEALISGGSAQ